jgi:hypothetical protein
MQKPKVSGNGVKLAHFKGWKLMVGFVIRLWIVLRWLRQLAKRGELKFLLMQTLVATVKDLRFLLQLTLARLLVRLEIRRRNAREESLKREAGKRRQLMALRRLAKRWPVERRAEVKPKSRLADNRLGLTSADETLVLRVPRFMNSFSIDKGAEGDMRNR